MNFLGFVRAPKQLHHADSDFQPNIDHEKDKYKGPDTVSGLFKRWSWIIVREVVEKIIISSGKKGSCEPQDLNPGRNAQEINGIKNALEYDCRRQDTRYFPMRY